MQVSVRDNNVDQALRALKKKLQREGVYRENSPVKKLKKRADYSAYWANISSVKNSWHHLSFVY